MYSNTFGSLLPYPVFSGFSWKNWSRQRMSCSRQNFKHSCNVPTSDTKYRPLAIAEATVACSNACKRFCEQYSIIKQLSFCTLLNQNQISAGIKVHTWRCSNCWSHRGWHSPSSSTSHPCSRGSIGSKQLGLWLKQKQDIKTSIIVLLQMYYRARKNTSSQAFSQILKSGCPKRATESAQISNSEGSTWKIK